jgi:phosphatidylglycerophosphatase A
MNRFVARALGSVLGTGFIPFAPGTVASLFALLAFYFVPAISGRIELFVPLIVLTVVIGVWSGGVMEEEYGEDPSSTVIDEVAGQWIALVALPFHPLLMLLSFIFFRVFDIFKPGPVDYVQRYPGGWGIMADDVLAGVMANMTVRLIMLVLPLLPYGFAL